MIQNQVKLPITIALDVVLQGIRIRMGRSLVTVMGVGFGIAFLMSILSGIVVRDAVKTEEDKRVAVRQMFNVLTAESGSLRDRTVGLIMCGQPSDIEERLLKTIAGENIKSLQMYAVTDSAVLSEPLQKLLPIKPATIADVATGASVLLICGSGTMTQWNDSIMISARQKLVALTRPDAAPIGSTIASIQLAAELKPELLKKMAEDAKRNSFRNLWIIFIALLVTIIGITNSMLMSVTERFREIGTMKCLGALSSFVRQIFFLEAVIIGLSGSLGGAVLGCIFALIVYGFIYSFAMVFGSINYLMVALYLLASLSAGTIMSVIAAIYPANFASRMVPATALRSNI